MPNKAGDAGHRRKRRARRFDVTFTDLDCGRVGFRGNRSFELRTLATAKMASERPDHSLDATALVHEAYLWLVGGTNGSTWEHRRQFFAAAAEAMRRVLIDHARSTQAGKRGGERDRVDLDRNADPAAAAPIDCSSSMMPWPNSPLRRFPIF